MSVRKRNEYLEGDQSDGDSDHGYDSEAAEEEKGAIPRRPTKRLRIEDASDGESADDLDGVTAGNAVTALLTEGEKPYGFDASPVEDEAAEEEDVSTSVGNTNRPPPPKQVAAAQKAARRSGVIYISRVPPFMKPQTLKHFLEPHAPKGLGRIFLSPEDHLAHSRRVKRGGNKKKSFTDGWVEFVSKTDAKVAAETLNGNIIGGKKGNFYHDDLWSMKYLKGFKWSHLTEQIANENAEREARMREEIRKTKQENKAFVDDIERGKMLEGMEKKRKAKGAGNVDVDGGGVSVRKEPPRNVFKQKAAQQERKDEHLSEQATRMQRLIF